MVGEEVAVVDRARQYVSDRQLLTSTGIAPDAMPVLTAFDATCIVIYSGTLEDISRWAIADALLWAENQARSEAKTPRDMFMLRERMWRQLLENGKLDISLGTAYNMAACAKRFEWPRRRHTQRVSFEHHRILVPLPDEEQEYWLDAVEDLALSVNALRVKLYGKGDPVSIYTPPELPALYDRSRIEAAVARVPLEYEPIVNLIHNIVKEYEDARQKQQAGIHPGVPERSATRVTPPRAGQDNAQ